MISCSFVLKDTFMVYVSNAAVCVALLHTKIAFLRGGREILETFTF